MRDPSDDRKRIFAMTATPDGKFYVFCRVHEVFLWNASAPSTLQRLTPVVEPVQGPTNGPRRRDENQPPRPDRPPADGPFRPFRMPPIWRGVAISPNGQYLDLSALSGEVRPLRIKGKRLEPMGWTGPKGYIRSMALSPDGSVIALSQPTGIVHLVNAITGAEVGRIAPPADLDKLGEATALAFAPNGRRLAVGLAAGIVRLVPLDDHGVPRLVKPTVRLKSHRGEVWTLAYSPDGDRLASSGADRSVSIWNFPALHAELGKRNLDW
jgi:WD40 repeat protein